MPNEKKQGFSLQGFDINHYRQSEAYAAAIDQLYNQAVQEFAMLAAKTKANPDKLFSFSDYPQTKAAAEQIIGKLAAKMQGVITKGSREQWLYACKKNDEFLSHILNTSSVPKAKLKKWQDQNLEALSSFQSRKVAGMDLSKRIWNYAGQMKTQMELGIDVSLGEGKSAQVLSKELRQYLVDPDKLFHRVRDKHGNLKLSKAAAAYHPGQGKYRSSYKNAMRLTRSEINMAYRTSDQLRWQKLDFVVGYEIKLSNNHTLNGEPFVDICDELAGRYPKSFLYKGWHPQCRCHAVPILMDRDEFNTDELNELRSALKGTQYKNLESKNTVRDVPPAFKDWIADNLERSQNWKSQPYFIKDNFVGGTLAGGLKVAEILKKAPIKPIKSPEQKADIQKRWNTRVATKKFNSQIKEIESQFGSVDSIAKFIGKVETVINQGATVEKVSFMVDMLKHKVQVKQAWDVRKVANKAKALLSKTTKMATNLVTKAEAIGMAGKELTDLKAGLAKEGITNAELNKLYSKLNSQYKKELSASADPFSKAALLKKYNQSEVDSLFKAYESFYDAKVNGKDIGTQMKKLEFEIDWLGKNGKYSTSGELKKLLERDLKNLKKTFELEMFKKEANDIILSNKSMNDKAVKDSVKALETALKNKDLDSSALKAAIENVSKAVDEYTANNIRTISPDDFKFFEDEKSAYSISKFYTESEKAKVKDLREKLNQTIKKAKGDIRNSSVLNAQKELTEYIYDIQFKYVANQKPLKHIGMKLNSKDEFEFDYITEAEAKAAFERYIVAKQTGSGFYSNSVGGEYWTPICREYTKRVKAAGVKLTSEATLPTRYFSGSSFINSYISKKDFSHVTSNKVLQESLHDYVSALSYSVSKLPRHNGVTYRGISYAKEIIDDLISCKTSGTAFTHKLGMSTSITPNVADNFGTGITFKIYGRSGIYAREFSAYSTELEVLYRPGSRFEVMEVYQETSANGIAHQGKWAVVLKEILD